VTVNHAFIKQKYNFSPFCGKIDQSLFPNQISIRILLITSEESITSRTLWKMSNKTKTDSQGYIFYTTVIAFLRPSELAITTKTAMI